MKEELRLGSIDSRLGRLLHVLSSLASVPEMPDRLESKPPASPFPVSLPTDEGFSNSPGLVVEFDEAYTAFVDGLENLPSESQMIALQAIDTKLSAMLRAQDAAHWTPQARIEHPCWIEVRVLVVDVMDAFSLQVDLADAPCANDAQ